MKKTLATLLLLCAVCVSSWGQERSDAFFSGKKSSDKVSLGIRGGLNLSQLATVMDEGTTREGRFAGFHAGVSLEVPIVESLGFETGLYFVQKAIREKTRDISMIDIEGHELWADRGELTTKGTPCYLEIPLLAAYRHNFRKVQLIVNTGPYLAYGICGKLKMTHEDHNGTTTSEQEYDWFGDEDAMGSVRVKRFDMGWHLGAGLKFKGSIYLGYSYEAGLVNIGRSDDYSTKTRSHAISLGFAF